MRILYKIRNYVQPIILARGVSSIMIHNKSNKEIKERWSREYKELEELVNEWDPVHLIRSGAPKDEYDCLTTQLLSLLHSGANPENISFFVLKELEEHFGQSIDGIKVEYREKYNKRVSEFCNKVFEWFNTTQH